MTTRGLSGEVVVPEIVLPVLVSAPVWTTFPVMVELLKVTAPEEPTLPVMEAPVVLTAAPRTAKGAAVSSGGASAANAADANSASKQGEKYFSLEFIASPPWFDFPGREQPLGLRIPSPAQLSTVRS